MTPGPWTASPFSSVVGSAITAQPNPAENQRLIAGVYSSMEDASVIAAAPLMFDVLEMIRDADDDCARDDLPRMPSTARAALDEALAAARGEDHAQDTECCCGRCTRERAALATRGES
jgi:hypothetical protein